MKQAAIKTADDKMGGSTNVSATATPAAPSSDVPAKKPRSRVHPVKRVLSFVASLRVTVVLMGLSLFLVFAGTLAQIDAGIWSVVGEYFRSFYVWIPFQLFLKFAQIFFHLPPEWQIPGSFPFPAGLTLGFALLFNLLAAHAVRFKLSWKRSGIILLHAGIVVMLVGEFITAEFAVEGNMPIENQLQSNYLESRQKYELVVNNISDPKENVEVVIPVTMLKPGAVLKNDALPFDIYVDSYYPNCTLTKADGKLEARETPVASGASSSAREDMPAAVITLKKKNSDEKIKTFLTSVWFTDWTMRRVAESDGVITSANKPDHHLVMPDGEQFDVALRWKRTYKPYSIGLEEFRHDLYPGTSKPKNFSSKIHLTNPEAQDERETTIKMNSPMRYRGETFYQSGWLPGDQGTVLQVVRNPGWMMPYLSCTMVALGMIIHFGMYLINFLRGRIA